MAYELYQTLEVSERATLDEIRRAYYRLVRKHSPEKDPEGFKAIRAAYETLSDLKARQNYDSLQRYGDEIEDLVEQAEERMSAEEWKSAIELLKRILVLAPGADAARNRLGLCYIHDKNWDFAVKVYRALTKTNPDVPLYWINFGYAYKEQAESLDDEDYNKAQLYRQARECFQVCTELESFNPEPYLQVASTYLDENNYSQALDWAERAVGADGKTDFQDFDALFFMCIVHLRSGEWQNIERISQRITSLLPDSEDARLYAASRFAKIGVEIAQFGSEIASINAFRASLTLLNAAKKFAPNDGDIREYYDYVELVVSAYDQFEILDEDFLIIDGVRRLAAFCLANALGIKDEDSDKKSLLDDIVEEILDSPTQFVLASVNRIKSNYLAIYSLRADLFNAIEDAAQELDAQPLNSTESSFSSSDASDNFMATALRFFHSMLGK